LFGKKFTIITDHEALKFIYHPHKSLARSSAAMVQRWNIALSAYDYTIQHRSAKQIQHVDYLSRQTLSQPENTSDCLLIQPLPVSRSQLIENTRHYYGSIMVAVKKGWSSNIKHRFPVFYAKRDDLSVTPDGILCFRDRIVIPPTLRTAVLDDLHSGHLGTDKMKSLARLTCWWPELDCDIRRTTKNCENCLHKIHSRASNWTPWPVSCEAWQRIHADYCGPFFGKYYALVVIDSYSKWPEVYFTNHATAEFTQYALRKVFSREGVPNVLVTDNGTHFTANSIEEWLRGIGCRHLFTAPRHPQSNGLAENFVKTLKCAITSVNPNSFAELERSVDNFLMQYRNAVHSTTKSSPAQLFKSRALRTNLKCLDSTEGNYFRGNNLRPSSGNILSNKGNRMVTILDLDDLTKHDRHIDQIHYFESGQYRSNSISVSPTNDECILDNTVSNDDSESVILPRRSERIRQMPPRDYKNPQHNSTCGGCDIHEH
jgi:Integrase zinc binding domain/Integrase core domain